MVRFMTIQSELYKNCIIWSYIL